MLNYPIYEKKLCKSCGSGLQKWGLNRNGSRRYRCSTCGKSDTRNRPDISLINHRKLYEEWLLSKFTLSDFGIKYGVDRRTLDRWFKPFRDYDVAPNEVDIDNGILIIDGYNLQHGATVLIAETPSNQIVGWSFTYAENYSTWLQFFNSISAFPNVIVCDGQKGMIKAIKLRFPGVIIQRCQFHVIHHVNILLTKNPETRAAETFKILVGGISKVKTEDDFRTWLLKYKGWYQQYNPFLKQKTYQDLETPTGRRTWHYTHGRLHSSHSHLKNALPNLFQYLKFKNVPNTSNRIEGGINAQIQRHIDRHRGTTLFQRRQIIAAVLKQKQLQKPTQNVT